jgi:hypothetical protein
LHPKILQRIVKAPTRVDRDLRGEAGAIVQVANGGNGWDGLECFLPNVFLPHLAASSVCCIDDLPARAVPGSARKFAIFDTSCSFCRTRRQTPRNCSHFPIGSSIPEDFW